MRNLLQTLQDSDLGYLRIIAELWGFDPPQGSVDQAAQVLAAAMLQPATAADFVESLAQGPREALSLILSHEGRYPLADIVHRFGPLRILGPGKRDREKPWRKGASPLEVLWYRGLIARTFLDTPSGPLEFLHVPIDLMAMLPQPPPTLGHPLGKPAPEPVRVILASSHATDDSTTLLAWLRAHPIRDLEAGLEVRQHIAPFLVQPRSHDLLLTLLVEESILVGEPLQPEPKATRAHLELPRSQAQIELLRAWNESTRWNDLAQVPGLGISGETWPNDPLTTRHASLGLFGRLKTGEWWDLAAFVQDVSAQRPGFQRPGGDFDSWYLVHTESGAFLRGFEHWDSVEGALLRYLISGPLHWLGAVDLGTPGKETPPSAFRLTPQALVLFDQEPPLAESPPETPPALIRPDGRITIPGEASRSLRYQVARFCAWERRDTSGYHFRLTPGSLQAASEQGLLHGHIASLLDRAGKGNVPRALLNALARWAERGREAHLQRALLVHVHQPQVMDELYGSRTTARYLGERLSPTHAVVRPQDVEPLLAAAARMGLLIDPPDTMRDQDR